MSDSGSLPGLLRKLEKLDRQLMAEQGSGDLGETMKQRMTLLRAVFAHRDINHWAVDSPQHLSAIGKRQQELLQHFHARRDLVGKQLEQLEQGRKAVAAYLAG